MREPEDSRGSKHDMEGPTGWRDPSPPARHPGEPGSHASPRLMQQRLGPLMVLARRARILGHLPNLKGALSCPTPSPSRGPRPLGAGRQMTYPQHHPASQTRLQLQGTAGETAGQEVAPRPLWPSVPIGAAQRAELKALLLTEGPHPHPVPPVVAPRLIISAALGDSVHEPHVV